MGKKIFKDDRICPQGKEKTFNGYSYTVEQVFSCATPDCHGSITIPSGTKRNFPPKNLRYCKDCLLVRKRLADIF